MIKANHKALWERAFKDAVKRGKFDELYYTDYDLAELVMLAMSEWSEIAVESRHAEWKQYQDTLTKGGNFLLTYNTYIRNTMEDKLAGVAVTCYEIIGYKNQLENIPDDFELDTTYLMSHKEANQGRICLYRFVFLEWKVVHGLVKALFAFINMLRTVPCAGNLLLDDYVKLKLKYNEETYH